MDVIDILQDSGELKPVSQWPKVWRQYLSGFEVAELTEGRGDNKKLIGVLKKIKWPDKLKNLEMLGKHLQVGAFVNKVDVTSADGSMSPKDNSAAVLAAIKAKHAGS